VRFEQPSHYSSLKALTEQRKPGLGYLHLLGSGDLAALLSGWSSFSLQSSLESRVWGWQRTTEASRALCEWYPSGLERGTFLSDTI